MTEEEQKNMCEKCEYCMPVYMCGWNTFLGCCYKDKKI